MSDTGLPDPRLAAALAAWSAAPAPATRDEALAALCGARVFAAITATSTAQHLDAGTGLRVESSAEMSLLSLVGSAGGRAVPLFLDAAGPVAFRDGARPIPLPAPDACGAALQDGAVAVLVDPPGAGLVVTGADLVELAAGRVPISGTGLSTRRVPGAQTGPNQTGPVQTGPVQTGPVQTGRTETGPTAIRPVRTPPETVDPVLLQALSRALRHEPVLSARVLQGPDGLVLGLVAELDPAALAALAARLLEQVRAALPPGGLDVAVVAPRGPGTPVPRRTGRLLSRRR